MFHLILDDDDERKGGKMKCHKLEVYGLLETNKIYFFLYVWLDDGDSEEKSSPEISKSILDSQ